MSDSKNDINLLEKVLTKLALTESDKEVETFLEQLLVPVLMKLNSPHEETKKKVFEVLTHINKTIKPNQNVKLPMLDLLNLMSEKETTNVMRNFIIIYVEMGFERCEDKLKGELIPNLLNGISSRTKLHKYTILKLSLEVKKKLYLHF